MNPLSGIVTLLLINCSVSDFLENYLPSDSHTNFMFLFFVSCIMFLVFEFLACQDGFQNGDNVRQGNQSILIDIYSISDSYPNIV